MGTCIRTANSLQKPPCLDETGASEAQCSCTIAPHLTKGDKSHPTVPASRVSLYEGDVPDGRHSIQGLTLQRETDERQLFD